MLAAWMSTTTSPGPAVGSGVSPRRRTSGPPCSVSSTAFIAPPPALSLPPQKLGQQLADPLRLLLLHPMAAAVDQITAQHSRASALLHALEIPGPLVGPPIALPRDKKRGDVDRTAREQLQLAVKPAPRPAPVPLQSTLEPGSFVFAAVDGELVFREPPAGRALGGRRHLGRHGFRHVLVQIHDVVGWHLGQLTRGPGFQRERLVAAPIRTLVVKIAAQKGMNALRTVAHIGIGGPGGVIPLIVLARPIELCQLLMDVGRG